jgi:hypothetical protein
MRFRPAHLLLSGALVLGALAACGGDDDGGSATKDTATKDADSSSKGSGGDSRVAEYCDDVEAYLNDLRPAIQKAVQDQDPSAVMSLQGRSQEIQRKGEELSKSLDDAAKQDLQDCGERLQTTVAELQQELAGTTQG